MSYIDKLYMATRLEWFEEGKKQSIKRLTELLYRTPPEYEWMKHQIETTIKQIRDDRPSDPPRSGSGAASD